MANGWGGRRPGSGSKPKLKKTQQQIADVIARCWQHERDGEPIDPLTWWFCLLNDPNAEPPRRDRAAEMLATYTIAKPKPVDEEGSSDNKLQIVIKDFSQQPVIAASAAPALISHISENNHETEGEPDDE